MTSLSRIESLLDDLSSFQADDVFNPWASNCHQTDAKNSFSIRRDNLRKVLCACAASDEIDVWIGRDLGWRGGRRTGIAFVDELALSDYAASIGAHELVKATIAPAMKERTATEIHLARARVSRRLFFWNVFPFHPHEINKYNSNRMHTRAERKVGLSFVEKILDLLPVKRVITVGKDAASALEHVGLDYLSVRHPSYGGQVEFHRQINYHYQLSAEKAQQKSLF